MSDTQLKAKQLITNGVFLHVTKEQYPKAYIKMADGYSYKAKDGSEKSVPESISEFDVYGDRIDFSRFQPGMPVTIYFTPGGTKWKDPKTGKTKVFNKLRLESMVIGHDGIQQQPAAPSYAPQAQSQRQSTDISHGYPQPQAQPVWAPPAPSDDDDLPF